jgi:hypothetical protein
MCSRATDRSRRLRLGALVSAIGGILLAGAAPARPPTNRRPLERMPLET